MELDWSNTACFTINPAKGDTSLIPEKRNWKIVLKGVSDDITLEVKVDGKLIDIDTKYSKETNSVQIGLQNISVNSKIEVQISAESSIVTDNAYAKEKAKEIITRAQIKYSVKGILWNIFNKPYGYTNSGCSQKEYAEILSAVMEMKNLHNNY